MIKRLDDNCVNDLLVLTCGIQPITRGMAEQMCKGYNPTNPCTQMYGVYNDDNELVEIMEVIYREAIEDKHIPRIAEIHSSYRRSDIKHFEYTDKLLDVIEEDAREHFKAHYIQCSKYIGVHYLQSKYNVLSNELIFKSLRQ